MLSPEHVIPDDFTQGANGLPVRPRPYAGELAHGFLARVAQANGYETPAMLLTAMHQVGIRNKDDMPRYLQIPKDEWSRLGGPWPRHCDCEDHLLPGLERCDYVHGSFRWCPACLAAAPYLRSVWAIKFCITCLDHGTYLMDLCPRCKREQRIEHFGKLRCICGQSLTDCSIQAAPAEVLELQTAFLKSSGRELEIALPKLSPSAWVKFLLRVAALVTPDRKGRTGQVAGLHRVSTALAAVDQAAQILLKWPMGFHALLADIQAKSATSFSLPRTFGRLYRWLYVDLADSDFAFLRQGFEAYLREHWWGVVCRRNQRVNASTGRQRMTIQEAAKRSGAAPSQIKQLHLAGVIEATTIEHKSGRHSWSLPRSAVNDLTNFASDGMTLKAAATFLALPKQRVRELIDFGLIHPRLVAGRHGSVWHLSRQELDRLGRAEHDASPQHGPLDDSLVPLAQVLKAWRLPSGAFSGLIAALSAGEIHCNEGAERDVPLGRWYVPVQPVKAWLLRWKADHLEVMSVTAAARAMSIKEEVAYHLVRTGLLQTHAPGNGTSRQVTAEGIRQFQEHYVGAVEVSRTLGTSPKALLATLAVRPVTGPMIDGGRQYFFKRSDVADLLAIGPFSQSARPNPSSHSKEKTQ